MKMTNPLFVGILIGALVCLPFAPWLTSTAHASPPLGQTSGVPSFENSNLRYPGTHVGLDETIYYSLALVDRLGISSFPTLGTPVSEQDALIGQLDMTPTQRFTLGDTVRGSLFYSGVEHGVQLYIASEIVVDNLTSNDPNEQATLAATGAQIRLITALADVTGSQAVPSSFMVIESVDGNAVIPLEAPTMDDVANAAAATAFVLGDDTGDLVSADLRLLSLHDRGLPTDPTMYQAVVASDLIDVAPEDRPSINPNVDPSISKDCGCDCNNDGLTDQMPASIYNQLCIDRQLAMTEYVREVRNANTEMERCLKTALAVSIGALLGYAACFALPVPPLVYACIMLALGAAGGAAVGIVVCDIDYTAALGTAKNNYEAAIEALCIVACGQVQQPE